MNNLKPPNLWILKSKGSESAFGGNEGYPDQIESHYVYDNNVKNHEKLTAGDLIIIAGKKYIEGFGKVERIATKKNVTRKRYRCPICNTQEHYFRKYLSPKFKCRNKHLFDEPAMEEIVVDQFTAVYDSTFISAPLGTETKLLDKFYIRRNLYYSIQPAKFDFFEINFPGIANQLLGSKDIKQPVNSVTFDAPPKTPYLPGSDDTRSLKTSKQPTRKGQRKFREKLFRMYGAVCMLSGYKVPTAIEASHIWPYRGENDNHPANGLLLRRDLHALFDADLIGINPDTMRISVHPDLSTSEYAQFEGQQIAFTRKDFQPSKAALDLRWQVFRYAKSGKLTRNSKD